MSFYFNVEFVSFSVPPYKIYFNFISCGANTAEGNMQNLLGYVRLGGQHDHPKIWGHPEFISGSGQFGGGTELSPILFLTGYRNQKVSSLCVWDAENEFSMTGGFRDTVIKI